MSSNNKPHDPIRIESRIDSLLSRMTMSEKIGQTNMRGTSSRETGGLSEALKTTVRDGKVGSFLNVMTPGNLDELQRIAIEESRHGIPLIFARDVIHGFKTIFPIPLGIASTWNPEIARIGARISAEEATAIGIRWTFAPMMDIARDARWGRIAESFGEDPFLSSTMASNMVKGFQTDDLTDPTSMIACAKHFAGYGAAEGGRDYNTAPIPARELHDVYLPPFRAAVESGVATFMTSFNEIDGVPASAHKELIIDTLRAQWGFDGFVVSDWAGITEMIDHGFVSDEKEAAFRSFDAGLNVEMATEAYENHLSDLIHTGRIEESHLDEMVRQILRIKFRMGLFETPYRVEGREQVILSDDSLNKAKEAALQSSILLKNDNQILPLKKEGKRYAVVGPMANAPHDQMGTWVFDGRAQNSQVPIDAIKEIVGEDNVEYAPGMTHSRNTSEAGFTEAMRAADAADIILFFAGEEAILSGEAHSLADIKLPGAQNELIERLSRRGKPLVLIVMSGRPNTIQPQIELSDAVLISFHPGTMAGPAIAELLFGVHSPAGRLPVTWPIAVGQIPIYYNHKNTGRPVEEDDFIGINDIPVGAWQSSLGNDSHYLDIGYKPAFPFGFGLTYSDVEYSDLKLSKSKVTLGDSLTISAKLTNIGKHAVTEVPQLYVRDIVGDVTRPVRELKGFQRIHLTPGQQQTVTFELCTNTLSFTNIAMKRVVEPGLFKCWVAPNSADGLEGEFEIIE